MPSLLDQITAMEPAEDRPEDSIASDSPRPDGGTAMEPAEDRPEDHAVFSSVPSTSVPQWSRPRIGRRTRRTERVTARAGGTAMEPAEDRPEDLRAQL